ncbi:hypothetical protein BXZ70DRAFT_334099 [Cristinia sonorae]|uniref:Uncharacterized protein n=1 Tax=Cristinia sonorae TaxID=1940300 RepID=A0A8K0UK04_9AGAR|nr:hypothetical protein BXZ70DRAFT_334099 [Cristinia sonorae]
MGRWTLDHHDNVLRNKLKNLISSAVKRNKLEKGEPTITYEAFVEELDEGDAFTSALIDVLVKEMAERRTRPNPIDRRLFISERTAKSLSLQASSRVYQSRSRRRFNFLEYPTAPPPLDPSDTEDDFGQPHELPAPEGVRINTDLYDAYASTYLPATGDAIRQSEHEGIMSRLLADLPPYPTDSEQALSPPPQSPPTTGFRNSFWGTSAAGSSLHRSHSLRRPTRSRTDAFHDFTLRRRLATRTNDDGENHSHDDTTGEGTWDFGGTSRFRDEAAASEAAAHGRAPLQHARRFFPLSAWTSARRRIPPGSAHVWGAEPAEPTTPEDAVRAGSQDATNEATGTSSGPQTSSQLWYTLTSGRTLPSTSTSGDQRRHSTGSSPRRLLAPRLRRGGIRAPESMLSRYASPSMESVATVVMADTPPSPERPTAPRSDDVGAETSLGSSSRDGAGGSWEPNEEAVQLLTPRSVSPPAEDA